MTRLLKRAEVGFRRGVLAGLTRLAAKRPDVEPPWTTRPVRVLFLRHDRIGDMVVSLAVIRAIARSHPNISLDVLASPINAAVVSHDPDVQDVVIFDRRRPGEYARLLRHFRRVQYDVVVDAMVFGQSLTTLLLMLATGAPQRVGVFKPGKPNVYTLWSTPPSDSDDHMKNHLSRLVVPFGIDPASARRSTIVLLDAERVAARARWGAGRRLLVNISAGERLRRWPDDRYREVVHHLRMKVPDARVLVMHSPSDRGRAETIARDSGAERADTPGLRDALALVAEAELVFTPDTSIVHVASAFDVPTVALFTFDEVDRWGPEATVSRAVIGAGLATNSIAVADALSAVDEVLAQLQLA